MNHPDHKLKFLRVLLAALILNSVSGCAVSRRVNFSIGSTSAQQFNQDSSQSDFRLTLKDRKEMTGKNPVLIYGKPNPLLLASLYLPDSNTYDNNFRLPSEQISRLEFDKEYRNDKGKGGLEGSLIGLSCGLALLLVPVYGEGGAVSQFKKSTALIFPFSGALLGFLFGSVIGKDETIIHVYDFSEMKPLPPLPAPTAGH